MGNWLEGYAKIMGLDVLTSTTIKNAVFDDSNKHWTVSIIRTQDGETTERKYLSSLSVLPSCLFWAS
jgi:hypothetical protein